MKRVLVAAAVLLCSGAQAANQAVLEWTPPTTYSDGTPIDAATPLSYGVYQGLRGQPKTKVATVTGRTTTITAGLANGTDVCWQLSTIANGQESVDRSNEACKAFPMPPANAPSGLVAK